MAIRMRYPSEGRDAAEGILRSAGRLLREYGRLGKDNVNRHGSQHPVRSTVYWRTTAASTPLI